MKVALIGIGGRVGSRLAAELLRRGHQVTGIVRSPNKVPPMAGVTIVAGDATQPGPLATLLAGHDAVLSAAKFQTSSAEALIAAVKQAGVPRLLVVGGAGTLEVAPGEALMDRADFPAAYLPEARAGATFLATLRAEQDVDWTYLSPSAELVPGKRTGKFRLGHDQVLTAASGDSWISMEDFAVALVDELEHPRHTRQRFTAGY